MFTLKYRYILAEIIRYIRNLNLHKVSSISNQPYLPKISEKFNSITQVKKTVTMWTKKLKINEIQSNILMYGEICGKEEIREISNREVIFSDRLLAYSGWHAAVHVPVFTILPTYIMKQIGNFFFKSLKKTQTILYWFFLNKKYL